MAAKKPFELTPAQLKRFNKCYGVYRKKAARGQDEITWAKYDFDDGMTDKIYEAIIAQNKADKGETHKKFLRSFSRWLNERGWSDEIESNHERLVKRDEKTCGCGGIAKHKGGYCDSCMAQKYVDSKHPASLYYQNSVSMRGIWGRDKLGQMKDETKEDWHERLGAYRKQKAKEMGARITGDRK